MIDVDQLVREALRRHESDVPSPDPIEVRPVAIRARRRQVRNTIGAGLLAVGLLLGAAGGVSAILRADGGRPATKPTPTLPPTPVPTDAGLTPVVFPPESAEPSTPGIGRLVVGFYAEDEVQPTRDYSQIEVTRIYVYEDGRVIWGTFPCDDPGPDCTLSKVLPDDPDAPNTDWVEQRLTAEAVETLREELLATGLFDDELFVDVSDADVTDYVGIDVRNGDRLVHFEGQPQQPLASPLLPRQIPELEHAFEILSDLEAWLPKDAWEDEEIKPYIARTYSFFFRPGPPPPRPSDLPSPADELLGPFLRGETECMSVSSAQARAIAEGFERAGIQRLGPDRLGYPVAAADPEQAVFFEPNLPDYGQC